MPVVSALEILLLAAIAVVVAAGAWTLRSMRCAREKRAINAGWQDQADARQTENDRLQNQNTDLMKQVNQYQAANKDVRNRSKELAETVRAATEARDELQRQVKELRSDLEVARAQRDNLRTDVESRNSRQQATAAALGERDERIDRLKREIANWQERVPPLVERYRARDAEARELEDELEKARARIAELRTTGAPDDTRIESMDTGGLDASNDQYEETSHRDMSAFEDQPLMSEESMNYPESYSRFPGDGDDEPHDDLKRIKGVGPAIEKLLNELGFFRYSQIAHMNDDDIARIAERLRGFGKRIEREDWVGQARVLDFEKNSHPH